MPPVLGPVSPSPTRLKSWAGGRASTVVPSVTQKTEASGPSRYSSMTTRPPGLARQAAAWALASSRSSVTTTPLPAARPSSLTTWGEPRSSRASSTSSGVVQTWARAVGTLAAAMTSLANALLPSSCAAAADGPKTRNPFARRTSATPATSGASGPMTTRSTASRVAISRTASASVTSASGSQRAMVSMPGFPGAATTASTASSAASARARACSRAPEPRTRTTQPATATTLGRTAADRQPAVHGTEPHGLTQRQVT